MPRIDVLVLALPLALAACDGGGSGTAVSIASGNGSAEIGRDGEVKIDTPAFQGSVKLPQMRLTADNFDIDGVHLYPGTRIANVDVLGSGKDDGKVTVKFDSPADLATVRGWLAQQFAAKGVEVGVVGDTLRGKSEDGEAFTIELTGAGARTSGVAHIG